MFAVCLLGQKVGNELRFAYAVFGLTMEMTSMHKYVNVDLSVRFKLELEIRESPEY